MSCRKQHIPAIKKALPVLVALCLMVLPAVAQYKNDTLKTVDIRSRHKTNTSNNRSEFATGQNIQTIDSTTMQQYEQRSVAALLSEQLPVFVKSYSFNGLATLNFRGASAAQSQVYWNGVPIQNAALGVADVSALPVMLLNKVSVVYGGSGALYGSGNAGGALLLESDAALFDTTRKTLSVSGSAGSFGQYTGGMKGNISTKRFFASGSAMVQQATNNYTYTNAAGNESSMTNGALQQIAATAHAAYKLNHKNTIGAAVWYQQYERQIPPALFEVYSVKKQQDNSLRIVTDWTREYDGGTIYAKASLIHDAIAYTDSAVQLSTTNGVYQYYHEAGWKHRLGEHGRLLLFTPVQVAWIPGSSDSMLQQKIAIAGAYTTKLLNSKLEAALQARAEQINGTNIFLPGGGVSYRLCNELMLRANVQRTYRMPSLNELYYVPGGNPALKPEKGWSEDAGYTLHIERKKITIHQEASIFNRLLQDWIIWLGGAVWTPHNIATVHSRGTETDNRITYKAGPVLLHAAVNTTYVIATTESSYMQNDGSIGKQIPYTPRYNGRLNIGGTWKRMYLNYNHSYTGYRFITTDESSWLEPYQTGNIMGSYTLPLRRHVLRLNAQYNNIWNTHYSVAGYRPMPGANWMVGFSMVL
jgi:vitamin B12 transporter